MARRRRRRPRRCATRSTIASGRAWTLSHQASSSSPRCHRASPRPRVLPSADGRQATARSRQGPMACVNNTRDRKAQVPPAGSNSDPVCGVARLSALACRDAHWHLNPERASSCWMCSAAATGLAQETEMSGHTQIRSSSGTLGIAVLVLGLTALAMYAPPSAFITAPALVLGGFYLYRHSAERRLRTLGVMATAIGLLVDRGDGDVHRVLPWVTPVGASVTIERRSSNVDWRDIARRADGPQSPGVPPGRRGSLRLDVAGPEGDPATGQVKVGSR